MSGQDQVEAYPLSWPAGWPRTPADEIERAKFGKRVRSEGSSWAMLQPVTNYGGRERLLDELARLGAEGVVMSTNIPVRLDGLPYSKASEPRDHGVAVYFRIKGEPRVLACDKWDRVADNMAALAAHIDAMRGQLRWGVGSVEQAFAGYKSLPPVANGAPRCWEILGLAPGSSLDAVRARRRELMRSAHPDLGGAAARAAEINQAADEAERLARS